MHQKRELEKVLLEITEDFFNPKKRFNEGDETRYYFAKSRLNALYLEEENHNGWMIRVLEYLQKKIYNRKSRRKLRKVYREATETYESFFKISDKVPLYDPREQKQPDHKV